MIKKLRTAIEKFNRSEVTQEFERTYSQLEALGIIHSMPLSEILSQEIHSYVNNREQHDSRTYNSRSRQFVNYKQRPGIKDML